MEHNKNLLVLANPEQTCPPEILRNQVPLAVVYRGFDNQNHTGRIEINNIATEDVKAFFDLASKLRFPIEKISPASSPTYQWDDEKLMAANVSSGFNYRLVTGTDKVSLHGQGLAFDVNPRQNPYIRYKAGETIIAPEGATWDINQPGTLYNDHPLVKLMLNRGWEWGGNWTLETGRIDYQHFQKPTAVLN